MLNALCALVLGQTLGINTGASLPYDNSKLWVDAIRNATPWTTDVRDDTGKAVPAKTDALGFPAEDSHCTLYLRYLAGGTYKLKYKGTGKLALTTGQVKQGDAVKGDDGFTRADVVIGSPHGNATLAASGLDPADPLRAVSLIPPGYDPERPPLFRQDAIRRFAVFPAGLRMMSLLGVSNSNVATWEARALPDQFAQSGGKGVAHEYVCELVRQLGSTTTWLNVPDSADDAYVAQMAQLYYRRLPADVSVILEYSNELWNAGFDQFTRNVARAKADSRLTAPDVVQRSAQLSALRTVEIARTWRDAFGADKGRIKVVFCGQNNQTSWVNAGIKYLKAKNMLNEIDAISTAPYVGIPMSIDAVGLTADALFAAMNRQLDGAVTTGIAAHATIAKSNGLAFYAYEGGPSIPAFRQGVGVVNADVKAAALNDPRMATLIGRLFDAWQKAGGGAWYVFGPPVSLPGSFGNWGLLDSPSDHGSVRWDYHLSRVLPPGDCTLDGKAGYPDYLLIRSNLLAAGPKWREDGDLDGDGDCDNDDVKILTRVGRFTDLERAAIVADVPEAPFVETAP